MRKGAAESSSVDSKFRTRCSSTFADVAYLENVTQVVAFFICCRCTHHNIKLWINQVFISNLAKFVLHIGIFRLKKAG